MSIFNSFNISLLFLRETEGFWVGKKSLRRFKNLAIEAYKIQNGTETSKLDMVVDQNDDNNNVEGSPNSSQDTSFNSTVKFSFNDDLLCQNHGIVLFYTVYEVGFLNYSPEVV